MSWRKPRTTKYPPPVVRQGDEFTERAGTDRYGYVVESILHDGWMIVARHYGRDTKFRWNHRRGAWEMIGHFSDAKGHRVYLAWERAESSIDRSF